MGLPKVTIYRIRSESGDAGTFGVLKTPSGFECYTGELPERDNKSGISCIPVGTYKCSQRFSEKHKKNVYGIEEVPGRSDCEIHSGNFCGDVTKGLKSDVLGCIILGRAIMEIAGQKAVTSSKDALAAFEADMEYKPFLLELKWADTLKPA